jgi:hypothetical protein
MASFVKAIEASRRMNRTEGDGGATGITIGRENCRFEIVSGNGALRKKRRCRLSENG